MDECGDSLRSHAYKGSFTQPEVRPQAETPHPDWQMQAVRAVLHPPEAQAES
jgi:hypothetical protein